MTKFLTRRMVDRLGQDLNHFSEVVDALRPIANLMLEELMKKYRDPKLVAEHKLVTSILVQYFHDSPDVMADVIADADTPDSFADLLSKFPRNDKRAIGLMRRR